MWKQKLIDFARKFNHPAWGFSHFTRVYEMSLELAKKQDINVDQDAIFAAAYLHDMGAFEPYRQEKIDHADSSVEGCEDVLKSIGFPDEKILSVKDMIKTHMYYAEPSNKKESIIFRDADILDFLGIIGITRILSIIGIDDWTPDSKSAIKLIKSFQKNLPEKLSTDLAKEIGKTRKIEMMGFLNKLSEESNNFNLL
ncbi:MAG: HD domain-containing protein [Promethearchaeota archaeon]|nr:MAG: HD domain-containing protein [Candidatus Lokiarchaeota archaeon]